MASQKFLDLTGLSYFWGKILEKLNSKVDKDGIKQLSTNDYTTEEKTKLGDLKIITVDTALSASSTNPLENKAINTALASKVSTSRKINGKALSADIVLSASEVSAISSSEKGSANGVAELDSTGKVPASQLPSFVDDVIEGYLYSGKFYLELAHTTEITAESGKIYVDLSTNKSYRWSGSAYIEVGGGSGVALGETSTTAYRGDRGKIAYDHSQTAHAPSNAKANVQSDWNVTDTGSDAFIKNKPNIPEMISITNAEIDAILGS